MSASTSVTVPVVVDELDVHRGAFRVGPLTLTVERGACAALIGPNGSGKSTLLLAVLGLIPAAGGEVRINGFRVTTTRPPAGTGALLSWPGFYPWVSGEENLKLAAEGDRSALRRVPQLLEEVGLTAAARRVVGDYSTGMLKRLEMARVLLFEPTLLVLDEPTNGLDAQARDWLLERLLERRAAGNAILLATHDTDLVAAVASQRIQLVDGAVRHVPAAG